MDAKFEPFTDNSVDMARDAHGVSDPGNLVGDLFHLVQDLAGSLQRCRVGQLGGDQEGTPCPGRG